MYINGGNPYIRDQVCTVEFGMNHLYKMVSKSTLNPL